MTTRRTQNLTELLKGWHGSGSCRAIAAEVGNHAEPKYSYTAGQLGKDDETKVDRYSLFLIASPTKPIVITAIMALVESGELQIDHLVQRYLPEFDQDGKEKIRVAHLMTHTSGLPDMLPNNEALRKDHAPLSEYMKGVATVPLGFQPGTKVSYQSMGILTLATIAEKIYGKPLRQLLDEVILTPLEMARTYLGLEEEASMPDNMTWSQVDDQPHATDWGWNSRYWRGLGAPWGGLMSSVDDMGRFCRHLLKIHSGFEGIISPITLTSMTTNRLTHFSSLSTAVVRSRAWGLGWQLNWPGHPRGFGSVLSPSTYGHWGATGTLVWLDPERDAYGVVLTTEPIEMENRRQIQFANVSALL